MKFNTIVKIPKVDAVETMDSDHIGLYSKSDGKLYKKDGTTEVEILDNSTLNRDDLVLTIDLNTPRFERINLNSGTGGLTMSFSYPTSLKEKTLIINNSRGTDVEIVFPTANVLSGGVNYVFHKSINSITVLNGYSAEIDFLCFFINSTNCEIRITSTNFDYKSA
jgi:hypothetical protein